MTYAESIAELLGSDVPGCHVDWGDIPAPPGGFTGGYKRLVEVVGLLVLDNFLVVLAPRDVTAIKNEGEPDRFVSPRPVEVSNGLGFSGEPVVWDEQIDPTSMVMWADVERGFTVHWEASGSSPRTVVTDYYEYNVFNMDVDEFLYKIMVGSIFSPMFQRCEWPGEGFMVEFD